MRVRTPEATRLRDLLVGPGVTVTGPAPGELTVAGLSSEQIGSSAARAGLPIYELAPVHASLEEAFMELTEDAVEYRSTTDHHSADHHSADHHSADHHSADHQTRPRHRAADHNEIAA